MKTRHMPITDLAETQDWCDQMRAINAELLAALQTIDAKYHAIMKPPPPWLDMTPDQRQTAREAWYGASLIARAAIAKATGKP